MEGLENEVYWLKIHRKINSKDSEPNVDDSTCLLKKCQFLFKLLPREIYPNSYPIVFKKENKKKEREDVFKKEYIKFHGDYVIFSKSLTKKYQLTYISESYW